MQQAAQLRAAQSASCSSRCSSNRSSSAHSSARASMAARASSSAPQLRHRRRSAALGHVAGAGRRPQQQRGALQVVAAVKKGSTKNVVCCKTLIAKEGSEEAVSGLCQGVLDFSKAAMADRSAGILSYECTRDSFEPHVFYFWERYDCNASMGRHNTAAPVAEFMEQVYEHLQQPIGMALYEWQDGKLGCACLQGGPKGEGGLDDASGASGAAGGAGMKQTSATVNLGKVSRGDEGDAWGMQAPAWAKLPSWLEGKQAAAK